MSHNSQLTTHNKNIILKAENISKQYRLGTVGTGTLKHDLNRWWHQIRGKEDPYLKIGDINDRSVKGESDYVWALQDINFEVERGEVLGIIGKNGAGKSTLLKILSRVTAPTTGSIKFGGRVASLLEVGTGFNGEMTGRENIFLNGAILGMTKKEIASKLDEIIEFSGCERYIDTPVKRYSSGMYVRLAFAVAAFLEPEILVIDEVLAVGDAEFQKKAIGKMQDISKGEGRTVLFVSHNMAAVKSLCTRGIVLEHGKVVFEGKIDSCLTRYINDYDSKNTLILDMCSINNSNIQIKDIKINNSNSCEIKLNADSNLLFIQVTGFIREEISFDLEARFFDKYDNPLAFYSPSHFSGMPPRYSKGSFLIEKKIQFPENINKGDVFMKIYLTHPGLETFLETKENILVSFDGFKMKNSWSFEIEKSGFMFLK
jgi:lipopolysaccharide transport system ATP-binding protein